MRFSPNFNMMSVTIIKGNILNLFKQIYNLGQSYTSNTV